MLFRSPSRVKVLVAVSSTMRPSVSVREAVHAWSSFDALGTAGSCARADDQFPNESATTASMDRMTRVDGKVGMTVLKLMR